jgi:hypothetical protein
LGKRSNSEADGVGWQIDLGGCGRWDPALVQREGKEASWRRDKAPKAGAGHTKLRKV